MLMMKNLADANSSLQCILYFAGRTIDGLLSSRNSVDSCHQAFDNTELVVDNFSQWGQAVGGARGIRDDLQMILLYLFTFIVNVDLGWKTKKNTFMEGS